MTDLIPTEKVTRRVLDQMIERFRKGDPTPLYFGDGDEPEAAVVPYLVVERLVDYRMIPEAPDDDAHRPTHFAVHLISSRSLPALLKHFRTNETRPFIFGRGLNPEREAAIIAIADFDRFIAHEDKAAVADQAMIAERRTVAREPGSTTFDEYLETLDEKIQSRVAEDRRKDPRADD